MSGLSLSNGLFLRFSPLEEEDTRRRTTECHLYSSTNFPEKAEKIMEYRKKKSYAYSKEKGYRNVFSYELYFMLPHEIRRESIGEFIRTFLKRYSLATERMLWGARIESVNGHPFVRIILFTRILEKKKVMEHERYVRDYWWNPAKKRMAAAGSEGAILLHRKGDIKRDAEGNPIRIARSVKRKEERIFSYRGRSGFIRMIDAMKNILSDLHEVVSVSPRSGRSYLPKWQIRDSHSACTGFRLRSLNALIDDVNADLELPYEALRYAFGEDEHWKRSFHAYLRDLNEILHSRTIEVDGREYHLSYHSPNDQFRDYLNAVRQNIKRTRERFLREWRNIAGTYGFS